MLTVETSDIKGITSFTTYDGGELNECKLKDYNLIITKYGDFVPQYGNPGVRTKQLKVLSFHKNGEIKSISLEQQTEVSTSIGIFPAELVTFFEDGSINSLFPLNGQISGFWSEEEEGALAQKYDFSFPFGNFSAKIIGLRFYPDGKVRSLILWPTERITIDTPAGKIPVRTGFKLFEDDSIESVEPAVPVPVETPIGLINAYDANALGIDADKNSLSFGINGRLTSLATFDIIMARKSNGEKKVIFPKLKPGLMEEYERVPIKLLFGDDTVTIDDGMKVTNYRISESMFKITGGDYKEATTCGDCSKCKGCM
ncbi:hypothetical protein [Methanosarcina sp. WH1]|uniref:hypothetical protein n=1 Tax=Methanosarcina sp. WH1 TaxID=1434102 RepID=UPI0006159E29|nr:hypothetical protein [Methanosarcina sp. WH1]AKB22108.1 hypothetical protein MSWH1_1837 [Methanosarcina sp. WH1]